MSISSAEVQTFTCGFSGLIDSGQSIVRSLAELSARETNPDLRKVIEQVNLAIQAGSLPSAAFSIYPTVFDTSYVGKVRQGEVGGTLQSALQGLCHS